MLFKEQIASYEKTEDTEVAKLKGKKKKNDHHDVITSL